MNDAEKQKLIGELKDFYKTLKSYKRLLDAKGEPTEPQKRYMESLREKLVRKVGALKTVITELTGKGYMESLGKSYNIWSTGLTAYSHRVRSICDTALDYCIDAVNEAIGKLETTSVAELAPKKTATEPIKAFISHGKGEGALLKLERFIRELGIVPIIVKDQASADRTVDDKVIDYLNGVDFVIIFATGDDKIKVKNKGKDEIIFQPRQNVIHEIGLAQKTHLGKIIYLLEEKAQFPSNISPKVYEGFARNSLDDAFTAIVRELKNWGFLKVDKEE